MHSCRYREKHPRGLLKLVGIKWQREKTRWCWQASKKAKVRDQLWISIGCGIFLWTHYLVKKGVISSSNSGPVGLSAYIHLNHWLDVVARQLSTLDNPNTNLHIASNSEAAEQTIYLGPFWKDTIDSLGWQTPTYSVQTARIHFQICYGNKNMFPKKITCMKLLALMQNQEKVHTLCSHVTWYEGYTIYWLQCISALVKPAVIHENSLNWHLWLSRNTVIKTRTIPGSPEAYWSRLYASYGWDGLACVWVSQAGLARWEHLGFHSDLLPPRLPHPHQPHHCILWSKTAIINILLIPKTWHPGSVWCIC